VNIHIFTVILQNFVLHYYYYIRLTAFFPGQPG